MKVNGQDYPLDKLPAPTLLALLAQLQIQPAQVAVEINEQIINRNNFENIQLAQNDILEIIHFVGGG